MCLSSLLPAFQAGCIGVLALHLKNSPGAAQLILCPQKHPAWHPPPGMHTEHWREQREGHPAVPGVPAPGASLVQRAQAGRGPRVAYASCSWLPPPLLPPSCPAEGLTLLEHPRTQPGCPLLSGLSFPARDGPGHSRGLQSTPPIQERWEQLPWEITHAPSPSVGIQRPSPAGTPNPSQQWWRGARGEGPAPTERDSICTLLPNSARGRAGAGPDPGPRRVFPAPVPVQEALEQPRLQPRAQCWEQGGGTETRGHGDLSQSSVFNCFSTPPWARLNARGPRCPCVTHPRA